MAQPSPKAVAARTVGRLVLGLQRDRHCEPPRTPPFNCQPRTPPWTATGPSTARGSANASCVSAASRASFFSCPSPIHSGSAEKPPTDAPLPRGRSRASVVISPPRQGSPPGEPWRGRIHPLPRTAAGELRSPAADAAHTMGNARQPFRRRVVPGTTRSTRTDHPLPCRWPAGSRRSYSGPAPPLRRLDRPTDFVGHRLPAGCRSGSQVSDGLRPDGHVASGCDPAGRSSHANPPERARSA